MFRAEILRPELYYIIPKEIQVTMIENDPLNADCFLYAVYYTKDLWGLNIDNEFREYINVLFWDIYNDRRKYYNMINKKIEELNNKK